MKSFVLAAQAGTTTVYAGKARVGSAQHTDRIEDAQVFDSRDSARLPTLIKFRNAVTGLQFEAVAV